MSTLLQDLRFAVRMLLRHPSFTIVAVLTLALGIGANTAIFSVINAVVLRPLGYQQPDQLIVIGTHAPERGLEHGGLSWPRFQAIAAESGSFASEFCARTGETSNLTGRGDPEQVTVRRVTESFFRTLGIQPVLGRAFLPDEDRRGGAPVAMISEAFWRQRFAADPHILGTTVTLDGAARTVVGIAPTTLEFPFNGTQFWVPSVSEVSGLIPLQVENGSMFLNSIARLKPGVTREAAQRILDVIAARYEQTQSGRVDAKLPLEARSFREAFFGPLRPTFLVLIGAVGFVLLIACTNVANLLLARSGSRRGELAVRVALGAGRGRLIRQLLTESVVIALVAGALGVLLATWCVSLVVPLGADLLLRSANVSVDGTMLAFTLAVSVLTGVGFGLWPALHATREVTADVLREGGTRGAASGSRAMRVRSNALIVAEVALSFVLLITAGLLILSFSHMLRMNPGFKPDGLFLAAVSLPPGRYPDDAGRSRFYEQLIEKMRALPGVQNAATTDSLPIEDEPLAPYAVEGKSLPPIQQRQMAMMSSVSPGYFATTEVPLVAGRDFDARDRMGSPPVVILSQKLARKLFPNESPVGQHLRTGMADTVKEIVGVVGDVHSAGLNEPVPDQFYVAQLQRGESATNLLIRTANPAAAATFGPTAQRALLALDKDQPFSKTRTMNDLIARALTQQRLTAWLLGLFGAVALLLAAVGIYGVVAYGVSQRTGEIGIRMALGAQRGHILRLVLGQGMIPVAIGLGLGLLGALGTTRLIATLLFRVGAADPVAYAAITVVLGGVGLLACLLPARRAVRLNPMVALRDE